MKTVKFKFLLMLTSIFFLSLTTCKANVAGLEDNDPVEVATDGIVRILAIGNSFSDDALEHYLHGLAEAAGTPIIIGNMYIGGATLNTHAQQVQEGKSSYSYRKIVNGIKTTTPNTSLATALADEPWDYISFQQGSPYAGLYDTYITPLPILYNYVKDQLKRPTTKYILHQTWAYAQSFDGRGFASYNNDQMTMYTAIVSAYNQVKNNHLIDAHLIVPAGTAIQNGRTSIIGDNFCRDGYHLDLTIGRYTASCAWYEAIFGKSVIGNTYQPPALSSFAVEIAQHAAHLATLNPSTVTPMTNHQTWPWADEMQDAIQISFGSAPTAPQGWNIFSNPTTEGYTLANLQDQHGTPTTLTIQLLSRFHGQNGAGPTATNTGRDIPPAVSANSFYGESWQAYNSTLTRESTLKLTGLTPGKQYNFCFFASRGSSTDNRITQYTLKGHTHTNALLNTSNNTTNIACAHNISPDDNGQIIIQVQAGTGNDTPQGFYYLGAIWISIAN
jgi:hypothetical protein